MPSSNQIVTVLKSSGAPERLIAWARECEGDHDPLWDTCPRPDWLVWIAATQGADFELLLNGSCHCAQLALSFVSGPTESLSTALEAIIGGDDLDGARELAEENAASYRHSPGPGFDELKAAVRTLLEARSFLDVLRARADAERQLEALHRSTIIGVPPAIMEPTAEPPMRLGARSKYSHLAHEDDRALLGYLTEALQHMVAALGHGTKLENARNAIADELYDALFSA